MLAITMRISGKKAVVGSIQLNLILRAHYNAEVLGAERANDTSIWVILPKGAKTILNAKQIADVLQKYFNSTITDIHVREVQSPPRTDIWYVVNPLDIDQELFEEERPDEKQEKTRQTILKAFAMLNSNPIKYGAKFMSTVPYHSGESYLSTTGKIILVGTEFEQVIEWAQRIANGETWEDMCNKKDTMNAYRIIYSDNERKEEILVGGCSCDGELNLAPTAVNEMYGEFGYWMKQFARKYFVTYNVSKYIERNVS